MTGRRAPRISPCCFRPMTRLYAKVKPIGGGNATMKATGWMCPEHRHLELDEETPFEKAWKIIDLLIGVVMLWIAWSIYTN